MRTKRDNLRTAIYAGSFDPITTGHIWVIEQGLKMFDCLYIAIGVNPSKKSYFSVDERREMINDYLASEGVSPLSAHVITFENQFLVDVAKEYDASTLLRGIRNNKDFEYELEIKMFNEQLNLDIDTVFVAPPHSLIGVSSSIVRGCVGLDNWEAAITPYTTEYVKNKFKERLQQNPR